MDEEATPPPASPLTNSGGGNKRSESPRSSVSGGRLVPHYLRASTGSCHDFCKHGRQEDRVSGFKDSRPWRKPVAGNGREDTGVTAILKKTVVVESKPSADHKIMSPPSEGIMGADMLTTTEYINLATEQASSCSTTTVTGEPFTSDSPETITPSVEKTKQQSSMPSESVIMATERDPLGAKDLKFSEKSLASSPSKPFLRSPSPVSAGSSAARSVDGRKSMEGRKSLDGRKVFESSKGIDERKNVQGSNTRDESRSLDKCMRIVPDTTQKCNGHGENAEHYSQDSMSEDKMKSVEGSQSSPEMESSEESNSLRLKDHTKDDSLGNGTISGKSELSKKQAAVPKPVILKMKASPSRTPVSAMPPSPLHPLSAPSRNLIAAKPPSPLHPSSAPSRSHIAAKPPSPLHPSSAPSRSNIAAKPPSHLHPSSTPSRSHIAAKPPSPLHPPSANSRNSIATKPSSPLHPSSGTCSKTINNNPAATKLSTSKLKMKKVDTSVVVSLSSGSSVDGGGISNMKQVRVIRVVSTKRRQIKVTNAAAKEHDDLGLTEDTSEAIKITPSKESVVNPNKEITSDSVRPSTPSVTKSIVRSRISYIPSRLKNSPAEPGQKTTAKVLPSSGLRKSKVVDTQPHTHRPSTLKAGRVALIGETAHTNRRSLHKRVSSGGITIEKSNSGRFLSRRPSARQKKNVEVLFNKVIEETASRLVRTSKSKVLALVGAFETVISIQRKSSAVSTPKSKKKSSSSKTYE